MCGGSAPQPHRAALSGRSRRQGRLNARCRRLRSRLCEEELPCIAWHHRQQQLLLTLACDRKWSKWRGDAEDAGCHLFQTRDNGEAAAAPHLGERQSRSAECENSGGCDKRSSASGIKVFLSILAAFLNAPRPGLSTPSTHTKGKYNTSSFSGFENSTFLFTHYGEH